MSRPRWMGPVVAGLLVAVAVGCSGPAADRTFTFGDDRPARLVVADDSPPDAPATLVVALHGFGGSAATYAEAAGLGALASGTGDRLLLPDGTLDEGGRRFWNASPACCDLRGSGVDDVAYLAGLITDVRAAWAIDRVVLVGFSNGAFMAHRLACERADLVDAIVAVAGAVDPSTCRPDEPVAVLAVHGTDDPLIRHDGGPGLMGGASYPGVLEGADHWASVLGCEPPTQRAPLEDGTVVWRSPGCPMGAAVEVWSVVGGSHTPVFGPDDPDRWEAWWSAVG